MCLFSGSVAKHRPGEYNSSGLTAAVRGAADRPYTGLMKENNQMFGENRQGRRGSVPRSLFLCFHKAARHPFRHTQCQRQWRLGLVDSLAQKRRIGGTRRVRESTASRFFQAPLAETRFLLILNGLRMIAGSRGAIGNDAAVMVGRPIRSRSFLFGKLVPHHRLVQRKLNIENLVELHFACPLAVESVGTLECEATRPADMVHRAG